jgi:hypothetical protein
MAMVEDIIVKRREENIISIETGFKRARDMVKF